MVIMLNTECFNQKESIPQSHLIFSFSFIAKLLEEAVEEAVAEAEVVEEEEEAQDDNFSYSGQFLGNSGQLPYSRQFQVYFVQVLFMVSIFNKLKCEKVSFLC